METITIRKALSIIAAAAVASDHDLSAKIEDETVILSRTLSRGRYQRVGYVELEDDGDDVTVVCGAYRIASTIRRIADSVSDYEITPATIY